MGDPAGTSTSLSAWMPYGQDHPDARLRLFCFPCAGSGASMFRTWTRYLPAGVDLRAVQLPGRENRRQEAPYTDLKPLVSDAAVALEPLLDKPFAMFGHSMGALVAFEAAREIRRRSGPVPIHLFLSSYPAGQTLGSRQLIADLPEEDFLAAALDYNWVPEQLLKNRELTTAVLSIFRADVAACESYAYLHETPFACPISAFGGLEDRHVDRSDLLAWREQTLGSFRLRLFPGDHAYFQGCRERLVSAIAAALGQV